MKFRDFFSVKHLLFALFIFAVMIPFAILQGNNTVKVTLAETQVQVKAPKYQMQIDYSFIESLELVPLADPGEKMNEESYDDDIMRFGLWKNETWGEYTVCADPDVDTCIVAYLEDGRVFVFNRKNNEETENIYQQILAKLPA